MAQNKLELKNSSEEYEHTNSNEHHEAAENLNLVSQEKKSRMKTNADTCRVQGHSRESSGTSNLSVKFTIEREGTCGSSPSITESVSMCSSPQDLSSHSSNSNFGPYSMCAKPSLVPASTKTRSKKRRSRKSVESSGHDSGALCEANSENEECENSNHSEIGSLEDEGITSDELSGEEKLLQQCCAKNMERTVPENSNMILLNPSSRGSNNNVDSYAVPSEVNATCNKSTESDLSSNSFISHKNPDVLDENTSKYHRFSSAVATPTAKNGNSDRNLHRRNISDAHQPLLSDDDSPSDTSCSENDAGANSLSYTRRKTIGNRNIRDQEPEQISERIENEDERHIIGEPLKTFVAFIFLFFAWVATTTSLALTHDRVPREDDPLPDIFLDNIKYQHWGLDASEIIIMISTWSAFLVTIFHKHRFIVLRRIFLLVGLHYYYRSITMFLTVLPVADTSYLKNTCMPASNETSPAVIAQRVLKLLSGMGLAINGKHVYCGDYIYSGHTMTLIMGYLVIRQYSPQRWFLLHYASMVTSIAGVVTLLLARGHYSIDVVIAYWITTRIWWMYHTMANNSNLKEIDGKKDNQNNFLKKLWWWYIFRYFECNVPENLPHKFTWPIPNALIHSRPVQFISQILKRGGRRRPNSEAPIENVESNVHLP